jgi:hypothetical protein
MSRTMRWKRLGSRFDGLAGLRQQHLLFRAARLAVEHLDVVLGLHAQVDQQGRVAAVIQDHVGPGAVAPVEDAVREVPVFLQRLALEGEHRGAAGRDGRRRMVLRGEDVAGGPADLRAQVLQGLDEHRGLDRHVQRARDARALEGLRLPELLAQGHQPRHLDLRQVDFLPPEIRQLDVPHHVVFAVLLRHVVLLKSLFFAPLSVP